MSLLDDASLIVTPNGYKGGSPNGTLYSVKPTNGDGDMVVTRNTTSTRVDSSGFIQNVAFNAPRLDYTGGGCPRILVETQRKNEVTYSEQFNDVSWSKYQATVSSNVEAAPDGTTTADLVYPTITGPITGQVYKNITTGISLGNVVTVSAFVKASGKNFAYISAIQNSFSPAAEFNLTTGAITNISAGSTPSMTAFVNGWWRISVSSTAGAGLYYAVIGSLDAAGNPANTNTASGTNGILIWGAQVEVGTTATSYIPTVASTITRNADVISKTGISSLIGQTEGTIFVEANLTANTAERRIITVSNGTDSQRIMFWTFGTTLYANFNTVSVAIGAFPIGTAKIALTYTIAGGSTTYSLKLNNNTLITGTAAAAAPTPLTNINLGSSPGGSLFLNDRIKSVTLFKTALSPTQLTNLTAI